MTKIKNEYFLKNNPQGFYHPRLCDDSFLLQIKGITPSKNTHQPFDFVGFKSQPQIKSPFPQVLFARKLISQD